MDYYNSKKLGYYFLKNVQHNACVFINDAQDKEHPLVAVNDTREPKGGNVEVIDVATAKTIYKGNFSIDANGRTLIATLPEMDGQGILLIKYTIEGEEYANHYLYGKPPFKLNEYKELLTKTKIYALN